MSTRRGVGYDPLTIIGPSTSTGFSNTLTSAPLTDYRVSTLPNASGTVALTSDIGLRRITPTSVAGTGVSFSENNVSFSGSTSISVNGVFSATYRNYRLVWSVNGSTSGAYLRYRNRATSTDSITNYTTVGALWGVSGGTGSGTNIGTGNQAVSSMIVGRIAGVTSAGGGTIDIHQPFIADYTVTNSTGGANNNNSSLESIQASGIHYLATSYNGFTIFPDAGNITGNLFIYGYA
jgi:hypothetical protein